MYSYFVGVSYYDIENAFILKQLLEKLITNKEAIIFEHEYDTLRFLVGVNACEKTKFRRLIGRFILPRVFKWMVQIEKKHPGFFDDIPANPI